MIVQILPSKQTPSDNDESSEGYAKDHSKDATQGCAPKENRHYDDYRMESGLVPHNARSEKITLDQLDDDKGKAAPCEDSP